MAGKKRKNPSQLADGIYSNKSRSRPSAEARVDPTYGQRSAIPGLDDHTTYGEEDDLMYDEDMDALVYLRSVRQEASGIPNLLVVPRIPKARDSYDIYQSGVGDFRARYEDGAYLAVADPLLEDPTDNSDGDEADAEAAYFNSIILRYVELRSRLTQMPPMEVVECLGSTHPTQVGPLNKKLTRWWIKNMQEVDPKPAQIACMNKSSVLRLLRLITQGSLLKRGSQVEFGISCWAWSLLAKLPDRGELNSEEIGVVRELGKKAVLVGMGLTEVEEWQQGMQDVEAEFEENLGGEEDAKAIDEEIPLDLEDDIYDEEDAEQAIDATQVTADSQSTDTTVQDPPARFDALDRGGDTESLVSGSSQTSVAEAKPAVTAEKIQDISSDEGEAEDCEALVTAKAQMLEKIRSYEDQVNLEPEISSSPKPRRPPSKLNTKATVDMIITIAGEIYGQRDLLELRSEWAHIT